MIAATFHGLALTDLLILIGVGGYLVDRALDAKGWSRSSKTLRRENEDLVRRNNELEETVVRHEQTIGKQGNAISLLEDKVRDLEKRDQAAVLAAVERHEQNASLRHGENADRHREALEMWTSIRDTLKEAAA